MKKQKIVFTSVFAATLMVIAGCQAATENTSNQNPQGQNIQTTLTVNEPGLNTESSNPAAGGSGMPADKKYVNATEQKAPEKPYSDADIAAFNEARKTQDVSKCDQISDAQAKALCVSELTPQTVSHKESAAAGTQAVNP